MRNKQIAVGIEVFCCPVLENCCSYSLHRTFFNVITLGGSWAFETKEDTLRVFTICNFLEDRVLNPGLGSCSKLLTQTCFSSSGVVKSRSMIVTDPYSLFLVNRQHFDLTSLQLCSALLQVKLHHWIQLSSSTKPFPPTPDAHSTFKCQIFADSIICLTYFSLMVVFFPLYFLH